MSTNRHARFNPFARSAMKFAEPLRLLSCDFDGTDSSYHLEYRASRGAANAGLLERQFKIGSPITVEGKHLVVRSAALTVTNSSVAEVSIRVEAVDFASVLAAANARTTAPVWADSQSPAPLAQPRTSLTTLLAKPVTRRLILK